MLAADASFGRLQRRAYLAKAAADAAVMLVGEQPGNDEDLVGRPFIGPAGKLLRELLLEAGITAAHVFITNAVKHFFYELRGKRRIQELRCNDTWRPVTSGSSRNWPACGRPSSWRSAPLRLAALTGRKLSIAAARGNDSRHDASGVPIVATYHPSAVLRVPDPAARVKLRAALLEDLQRAARIVAQHPNGDPAAG